ncbi:MAG: hypothetical protein AAGG02_04160 [Cyanobacteria bacterium P01_H01_bin.15]
MNLLPFLTSLLLIPGLWLTINLTESLAWADAAPEEPSQLVASRDYVIKTVREDKVLLVAPTVSEEPSQDLLWPSLTEIGQNYFISGTRATVEQQENKLIPGIVVYVQPKVVAQSSTNTQERVN